MTVTGIDVDGVFNLRDLGGFATADGGRTRSGLVIRADGLHRTDGAGRDRLVERGLRTVIDLRTSEELEREGRFDHADVAFHHVPVIDSLDEAAGADRAEALAAGEDLLLTSYLGWLHERGGAFARALDLVADSVEAGAPVAYHCTAGKDRTGVITALILSRAGVGDDDITADYGRSAPVVTHLMEWYARNSDDAQRQAMMDRVGDANVRAAMMGAEPTTMAAVLAHLRTEWGGVAPYLDHIGADGAATRIAAVLAEPTDGA